MKRSITIELTQGYSTIVDVEDAASVTQWRWKVLKARDLRYAARTICGRRLSNGRRQYTTVLLHRVLMKAERGQLIDHKNGDGLDNRRSNLRFCSSSENGANQHKPVRGFSRFRGVYWNKEKSKWQAQISGRATNDGRHVYLGRFDSEIAAARAYDKAAYAKHPCFAKLNFKRKA